MSLSDSLCAAAQAIGRARRLAVLTGAGISTPSGIPDFRSADGLYADARNEGVFDIAIFRERPEHFYRFAREFYPVLERAQPNAAHQILARWEREGRNVEVATQNIDDLHQRSGSRRVYPVHGTAEASHCTNCGAGRPTRTLWPEVAAGRVPRCSCGGVFKPDITFFGEMLPEDAWTRSARAMSEADVVLVIGTSLAVYPAASLPDGRRRSAGLFIFNRDSTPLDDAATGVFRGDVVVQLQRLADAIEAAHGVRSG